MWSNVNNIIHCSWKLRVTKVIQLLHWMTMWMENTWILVSYNLVNFSFNVFNEPNIFDWWISGNLFLSLWCWIDIDSNCIFDPFFKLGHFLSRKLISATRNMNASVIIENEFSIFKSPTVVFKPLLFIFNTLVSFNVLFFKNSL